MWFGLPGGAHPAFISTAEEMGREVSEWLSWYGGTLEATMRVASERAQDRRRLEEMRALLHDARAPVGVLKYMTHGEREDDVLSSMRQELDYLDSILSQGAPREAHGAVALSCDVGEILHKVYRRCAREGGEGAIFLEVGYCSFYARFPPLELERIVTNLVSNARRHAPLAQIRIGVEEEANTLVVYVRDNGPGIPAQTLRALREGVRVSSARESGWGVGLQSCVTKARELGGKVSIASREGEGTCVRVVMLRGDAPLEVQRLEVADGGVASKGQKRVVDVCVVDDDKEHGRSLARLLRNFGLRVGESESLESFLRDFENERVSSILCDAHMPDGGAERLLPILATSSKPARLAVVSGDSSDDHLYRLAALGAQAFFTKPVDVDEVVEWVRGTGDRGANP
jgi:CheY-like chemotaxis protein/anti-sigma regulatory factor (Ser/Thr protein kinase)